MVIDRCRLAWGKGVEDGHLLGFFDQHIGDNIISW